LKETIVHKKTGYLISEKAEIDEIVNAVEYLDRIRCIKMKPNCEKRAGDFGLQSFANDLKKHVE